MARVKVKQLYPGSTGQVPTVQPSGQVVWQTPTASSIPYQMQLGGKIKVIADVGSEIVAVAKTLTNLQGRRGTAGAGGGTTTIELTINGVLQGVTLSWTNADGAMALKTAAISKAVVAGDRLAFNVTAAENGNPQDLFIEVD